MPNPKTGTVTMDVARAVEDVKAGKIEYRTDRSGIVHVPIGKKSFEESALVENYGAVLEEILRVKPSAAKGRYLKASRWRRRWAPASRSTPREPRPDGGLGLAPRSHEATSALVAGDRRGPQPAQAAARRGRDHPRSVDSLRPPSHGGRRVPRKEVKAC